MPALVRFQFGYGQKDNVLTELVGSGPVCVCPVLMRGRRGILPAARNRNMHVCSPSRLRTFLGSEV